MFASLVPGSIDWSVLDTSGAPACSDGPAHDDSGCCYSFPCKSGVTVHGNNSHMYVANYEWHVA